MWNRDNELFTELSSSEIGFSTAWNRSGWGPPHAASVVEVENGSFNGLRVSQVGLRYRTTRGPHTHIGANLECACAFDDGEGALCSYSG
jgi:hypothetical protein